MRIRTKFICKHCNNEFFDVQSKNRKYCSISCKAESQKNGIKHICVVCGKQFEVFKKYSDQYSPKFCSQKCRSSQKIKKVCKNCNIIFEVKPSQASQIFCTRKCQVAYSKFNCRTICRFCGKEFYKMYPSNDIKYCSDKCRYLSRKVKSICKYCGEEFYHMQSTNQSYCSLSCSNSAPHKIKVLVKNTMERIKNGECISKTELLLKDGLIHAGFIPQYISDYGSIDYACVDSKIAVFVDGAFWHGREDNHWRNTSFKNKIEANKLRDKKQNESLKKDGWIVLRYWDDHVRKYTDECIFDILSHLNNE